MWFSLTPNYEQIFPIQKTSQDDQPSSKLCINGEGADFEITVDDGRFLVHKSVIFPHCAYLDEFSLLIQSSVFNSINISPVTDKIIKVILKGFYSGEKESLKMFNMAEKMKYLTALLILGNKEFLEPCLSEVIDEVRLDNCIQLLRFAQSYKFSKLQQKCVEYIGRQFPKIIVLESYESLSFREIFHIFNQADIVATPYQMFYGINKWLMGPHVDLDNWSFYARELIYECNRVLRERQYYTPYFPWENSFYVSECDDEELLDCFSQIAAEYRLRQNSYYDSSDEGYSDDDC